MERLGVPTVTLFTQAFAGLATAVALGQQAGELHRVVLPHPLNDRPEADIRAALVAKMRAIVGGLTEPA